MDDHDAAQHRKPLRLLLAGEEAFRRRLEPKHIAALARWHNVEFDYVREFVMSAPADREAESDEHRQFVSDLEAAIELGVSYTGVVYRGMSSGDWRPERMAYLRTLINRREEFVFNAPASASHREDIGRGWMFCEPDDEERHLAVLLMLHVRTARCFPSIVHAAGDESEVIIPRGTRFQRKSHRRLNPDPKPGLQAFEIELVEA